MADVQTDDEKDRAAAVPVGVHTGSGAALADEGNDDLPALAAIGIGLALVIALLWPGLLSGGDDDDDAEGNVVAAAAGDLEGDADGDADAEADGEADGDADGLALPDIPAIQALADGTADGVSVDGDGTTVVLSGVVADDATRTALIELAAGQPNVEAVDSSGLTVAEADAGTPAAGPGVDITASQVQLILEGTVPDEETRVALVERAVAIYSEDEVEDRLVVDSDTTAPFEIRVSGSMTDEVLYNQVSGAFDDVDGVNVSTDNFELIESSDLEASLNSLEPIQFASGSAQIRDDSQVIVDEAAALLQANPDVVLEIGGHTDSIGGTEANQSLSESRARAVSDALQSRGVTNELRARGFGETRLKVANDENDSAAQQQNRRIEFRIIG